MDTFGNLIRQQRESRALPLRTIAAFLDMDQAVLSKIERGKRKATREQVVRLAGYFDMDEEKLLVAWLSDRIVNEISGEDFAKKVLKVAERKMEYKAQNRKNNF